MTDARDQELVARAQNGDGAAAGLLYDRHHERIFRFVWSRVGHRQLAEDLTGEIFIRMVDRLGTYVPRGVPFRAWLFQIARNLITDTYRRDGRQLFLPLDEMATAPSQAPPVETITDFNLTLEKALWAFEQIDPRQRDVVALRFLAGLSLEETAASLQESIPAVKALQHRGLKALRLALAQECHP